MSAIAPPSFEDYLKFLNGDPNDYAPDREAYVESVLLMATDAFWALTGISDYPNDERLTRIINYALMDLTAWIVTQSDNREAINSPFTSERIGSYSYSKMQQAKDGSTTGIYWLDMLFKLLSSSESAGFAWVSSENVFNPQWKSLEELQQEPIIAPDPWPMG